MAPIPITKLNDKSPGLQLIVMSFDGFLYIVDGYNGCVETNDVGEVAYAMVSSSESDRAGAGCVGVMFRASLDIPPLDTHAKHEAKHPNSLVFFFSCLAERSPDSLCLRQPLVEDLDGDGKLELLVSTMNGNLFVYETGAPFHPLKTWPSQVLSRNGFTARWEYQGIAILPHSRGFRDIGGDAMQIQFEIIDRRPRMNSSESRKYSVDVSAESSQVLGSHSLAARACHVSLSLSLSL